MPFSLGSGQNERVFVCFDTLSFEELSHFFGTDHFTLAMFVFKIQAQTHNFWVPLLLAKILKVIELGVKFQLFMRKIQNVFVFVKSIMSNDHNFSCGLKFKRLEMDPLLKKAI